ncbi:MAG: hypothetical protein FWD57_13850, partial [Polyangiaceae bacterium]|nr:hypothetical protein [Polyangiaceae bacterium]
MITRTRARKHTDRRYSMTITRWFLLVIASAALGLCILPGCYDGELASKREPTPPTSADELSSWGIRILVGPPDDLQILELPPPRHYVSDPSGGAALDSGSGSAGDETRNANGGYQTMAGVIGADGGHDFDQYDESIGYRSLDGYLMLWAAATECKMDVREASAFGAQQIIIPPWLVDPNQQRQAWYIFGEKPSSCSRITAYQEILLCIAQKLSDAADLVAPEQWDGPTMVPLGHMPPNFPEGPYIIPPQRAQDKFILRTMAQNAIAHIALLDMTVPTNAVGYGEERVCSTLYREGLEAHTGLTQEQKDYLFENGSAYFDPILPPPDLDDPRDVTIMINTRMLFQAHILRAAARLSKYLTETSLYADLAGTEQRRAAETDPVRGAMVAWGHRRNDELPYNTLSHAVRGIAGRWEMGPHQPDPICAGVPAWNLLQGAYGPSLTARSTDRPPTTPGKHLATDIIDSNGIVLPWYALEGTPFSDVRAAVREQLIFNAAAKQGIDPLLDPSGYDDYITKQMGLAVGAAFDGVADGDLLFALKRSLSNYRILTDGDGGWLWEDAGLKSANATTGVDLLGGLVLVNGTPKSDMSGDIAALASGVMAASQCAVDKDAEQYSDLATMSAFQDSYSLAQSLYRRLVVLREEAPVGSDAHKVANQAAAEVRAWAGQGRISVVPNAPPYMGGVQGIRVDLLGLDPRLLDVGGVQKPEDQIALVWGPKWVADCATKQRTTCPEDFATNYMVQTDTAAPIPGSTTRTTGFDGDSWRLEFSPLWTALNFRPDSYSFGMRWNFHLYVILKSDPDQPSRGKVLAALSFRKHDKGTSAVVSRDKNMHLKNIIGFKGIAYSKSPGYCIEGVPRDMFVPLESELTSDSDLYENSWRHYLTMAQTAAARADQLGEKLIEIGLQQDLRREAAAEDLAQLCGVYASLDSIGFEKGNVIPPADDEVLKVCLGEKSVDLVFLTEDQVEEGVVKARDVVNCDKYPEQRVCDEEHEISTDGLGLARSSVEAPASPESCNRAVDALMSLRTGFDPTALDSIVRESWMRPDALEGILRDLRLNS